MIFLGNTFLSGEHSGNITPTNLSINKIELSNGIYDNIFISKENIECNKENIMWDYDTVLYALFNNNLLAGNISNAIETISSIRIKQRKKGEFDWKTIDEIPITKADDLQLIRTYKYCRSNTIYEFALVPVLNNNIEGNMNITEVESKFDGVYIIEKDTMVHAFINLKLSHHKEQSNSIIKTLGREKPFYISNGLCKYDTGTLSATFIQLNDDCSLNIDDGWKYREEIDKFLSDNKIKIIKNSEGKMWMVCIVDAIQQDFSEYYKMPLHTITWNEIGNCESIDDLFQNGFIDVCLEVMNHD